jgi:hypothetical protein
LFIEDKSINVVYLRLMHTDCLFKIKSYWMFIRDKFIYWMFIRDKFIYWWFIGDKFIYWLFIRDKCIMDHNMVA